jgi:hypothetical protein
MNCFDLVVFTEGAVTDDLSSALAWPVVDFVLPVGVPGPGVTQTRRPETKQLIMTTGLTDS